VGGWTGVSRLLGFLRDMLVGRFLGAGRMSDIFLTAFKLPNLFRDLLGEGALSSVFIPMFSREKRSASFASSVFSWLMLVLLAITILAEIFMPLIMLGLAPGFDPEKLQMTVEVGRIMFFYVILVCGAGFLSAILNAFSDFALAAFIPVLLNVSLIAGLLIFRTNLYALAGAVLLAGAVQMWILIGRLRRRNFGLRLIRPRLSPAVKGVGRRLGWGFLGSGFYQLNVIVGVMIASRQGGAVSWLYYSDRLVQLPFAIVGLAAGTVILTKISDAISSGKMGAVFGYQNAAMRQSMMLILPCMAGLLALARPIVGFLFGYGEWTPEATRAVADAIMIQVLVLPFMTATQIYQKTLYAAGDVQSPVKVSAVFLALGVLVMLALAPRIGYLCVPVGTAVSGILRNQALRRICVRRELYKTDWRTIAAIAAFFVLSLLLGVGLWLARPLITGVAALAAALAISMIIYLPSAFVCDRIIRVRK
jgi:putative peptidoglycan lipid II flippase